MTLDIDQLGVLILAGPGALDVARAIAVATLAAHEPRTAELVVVGDLLPPGTFPGLTRPSDIVEGLRRVEVELVHRTRVLDTAGVTNATALRAHDSGEPLPALLLVASLVPQHIRRVQALATLGQRLGVAVLLTTTEHRDAALMPGWIHVPADGIPLAYPDELTQLAGTRLHRLTSAEAGELLAQIATARRGEAAPEPDQTPSTSPQPPPQQPFRPPLRPDRPPIMVRLLGAVRVEVNGREIRTGVRDASRELLGYFILHPEGSTLPSAAARLWPDADIPGQAHEGQAQKKFRNALYSLRSLLRAETGRDDLQVVERVGEGYRLQDGVLDTDVWRLQRALEEAHQATSPTTEAAALETAADVYGGPLARGDWAWADPEQRSLHDKVMDALVRLAELREHAGDDDGAVAALERAITLDPTAEESYRHLMRLHAHRGYTDALRRVFARLRHALDEIDTDPDPSTVRLYADLRSALSRANQHTPPTNGSHDTP